MRDYLNAVRAACSAKVWSHGVELVRGGAVLGEHEAPGEVTARVSTRRGLISATVTLYLDDEEWECSCGSSEDPCEHVAATTIALNRARKDGKGLPTPGETSGALRYLLARGRPGLCLEREIVTGARSETLTSSLEAIASGRVDGPAFSASQADLAAELALGPNRRGPVPPGVLPKLFAALERCDDVRLDGRAVQVSPQPVLPRARLVDAPGGFRLFLDSGPDVSETLGDDVVLCGDTLHLLGHGGLTGRELQDLPRGRFFAHGQVAELLTEILPSLGERIEVDVASTRLPETTASERPRILIELARSGDALSVLPLLVYGDPPSARIDADHLVHLSGKLPVRDREAEALRARQLHDELGLTAGHRVELAPEEAVPFVNRLERWGGEVVGEARRDFYLGPQLVPRLDVGEDRIDLSFASPEAEAAMLEPGSGDGALAQEPRHASAEAVLRSWQAGGSLVPLSGGGFAELPRDWLERFGHRVADLLAAQAARGSLPGSAIPDLGLLCDDLDTPRPASLERLRPLFEGFESVPPARLPEDLHGELRHYQRVGVDWLCFMRDAGLGALLADDMGLGKTLQALCALDGRCLVVTPTSVLYNWVDEIRRFRPDLSFSLYHGPRRELDEQAQVTLTSYALLRLDAERLVAVDWDTVVLDEAQNIKNPDSQVAQAAYRLRAGHRIALTGTPVENRLDELWSQLHFLNPGLLGGRRDFRERYAKPIVEGDAEAAQRLRDRIRPFLVRRRKREVAPELPPRTEIVLHCELDEAERQVYDAVRATMVESVVEQLRAGGSVMAALEALLRLRQAACHSSLVPGQKAASSSKLRLLCSRLEEAVADGHRALVFSQWTSLLDLVEPELAALQIEFSRLDGATRNRGEVVRRFQDDEGPPVMLVSLKAGGTGLNLTAADHIFLLDPWWNPAVEDQAADRAHRIGQTRPVAVHRLVAVDTVEEGILALHSRKRALSETAIGSGSAADGLTRAELLSLLS